MASKLLVAGQGFGSNPGTIPSKLKSAYRTQAIVTVRNNTGEWFVRGCAGVDVQWASFF